MPTMAVLPPSDTGLHGRERSDSDSPRRREVPFPLESPAHQSKLAFLK